MLRQLFTLRLGPDAHYSSDWCTDPQKEKKTNQQKFHFITANNHDYWFGLVGFNDIAT